jgi:hypothetical protein
MMAGAIAIPGLAELRKKARAKNQVHPARPSKSVLVRSHGATGKAKGVAKGAKAAKSAVKGGVGSEAAKAKKLVAPAKTGAGKDLAAVKKSLAAHKAAGLKATGPARSVLVRDKAAAGKSLRSAKAGLGGPLGRLKSLKKAAGASAPVKSLGKAASAAQKAQPQTDKAVQMGRLLRSI